MSNDLILNLGGGGGAPLNFKVVGNPLPSNPKENTIWLNTDTKITGWYFDTKQPSNLAEGEVWVSVSISSPSAFNALKKNTIQVYPVFAKQNINGTLTPVEAKIYQGGAWVEWWEGGLFDNGNQFEAVTGGWNGSVGNVITVTGSGTTHNAHTKKMIDLSGKSKLYATVDSVTKVPTGASFGVAIRLARSVPASTSITGNESPIVHNEVVALANAQSATTLSIDVSSIDVPVCVVVVGHPNGGSGTVSKIWTE